MPNPSQLARSTRRLSRRALRLRRLPAVVVLVALVFVVVTASDAAGYTPAPQPRSVGNQASLVEDQTIRVSRAKVQLHVPPFYLRGDVQFCLRYMDGSGSVGLGTLEDHPDFSPCPPEYRHPTTDPRYRYKLVGGGGDLYVVTKGGRNPIYGSLPSFRVHALAFGTIPIEATVHLTQAARKGVMVPLHAEVTTNTDDNQLDPNNLRQPTWPGFPKAPPATGFGPILMLRNTLSGAFDTQLTNVAVDGRPVAVGSNCRTTRPTTLTAEGATGYYYLNSNDSPLPRGTPGSFDPADYSIPGIFDANAVIPPFANCGTGADNIDRILTAFVSGSQNAVSGYLPINPVFTDWCTSIPIADCTSSQRRSAARVQAYQVAARNGKPAAELARLRARIKPSDEFPAAISAAGRPIK